ncbi:hypothetical protein D187_001280 [Cystobacter fuscus DSM 2262]|uniref:Uncharacterized protein n=1 Tax=Cystobacter fuscus (strain ATCC 25194 / DSM 2262 / NBRC 100088 / M29) TaxID=1242864 RepID=S9PGH0_CYSF2|nr:hypothetical protein D187_001280 [Cystobacter fuscus DSM 2262]
MNVHGNPSQSEMTQSLDLLPGVSSLLTRVQSPGQTFSQD